jgi:hypothetical protein
MAQRLADLVAGFGGKHFALPIERHQHRGLFGDVGGGGVVGFPHGDQQQAEQYRVNHASGQEHRNDHVVVALRHMLVDDRAAHQHAHHGEHDGAADEECAHQNWIHGAALMASAAVLDVMPIPRSKPRRKLSGAAAFHRGGIATIHRRAVSP